jgi:hypothetical protein
VSRKLKKYSLLILAIVVSGLICWFLFLQTPPPPPEIPVSSQKKAIYNFDIKHCPAGEKILTAADIYMTGVLDKGTPFKTKLNWYLCHDLHRGDLVLYRFSFNDNPVVRRAVGIPGDRYEVVLNELGQGWNLKINQKYTTDQDGKKSHFGVKESSPPLALYSNSKNAKLGPNEAILLSNISPGQNDSGGFGIVTTNDIIGSVEPIRH